VSIKTLIFETGKDGDVKHPKKDPLICDISNDLDKDHTLACAFSIKKESRSKTSGSLLSGNSAYVCRTKTSPVRIQPRVFFFPTFCGVG
jgi:hypothetical protein